MKNTSYHTTDGVAPARNGSSARTYTRTRVLSAGTLLNEQPSSAGGGSAPAALALADESESENASASSTFMRYDSILHRQAPVQDGACVSMLRAQSLRYAAARIQDTELILQSLLKSPDECRITTTHSP